MTHCLTESILKAYMIDSHYSNLYHNTNKYYTLINQYPKIFVPVPSSPLSIT